MNVALFSLVLGGVTGLSPFFSVSSSSLPFSYHISGLLFQRSFLSAFFRSGPWRLSLDDFKFSSFLSAPVICDSKSLFDEQFIGQSLEADSAELMLSRCSFVLNRVSDAVSVSNAPLTALDCVFRSNSGGAVQVANTKLAVFKRCLFSENSASALSAISVSHLEISESLFRRNFGSALSAARCAQMFVTNTNFSENGDSFVAVSSTVEVDRCDFWDNNGPSFVGVEVFSKFRSCGLSDSPTAASFSGEGEFDGCDVSGEITSQGIVRKIDCRERPHVLEVSRKKWRYAKVRRKTPCSSCQAKRERAKQSRAARRAALKANGTRKTDKGASSTSVMLGYVAGIAWLVVVLKLFSDQADKEAQAPNALADNSLLVDANFEQLDREDIGFPHQTGETRRA